MANGMDRDQRAKALAEVAVGETLPVFERTTGFAEWNRFAAVNDEFIDVHMDAAAARAVRRAVSSAKSRPPKATPRPSSSRKRAP